jgi:hypothetical protein
MLFARWGYEKIRRDKSGKRWNFCYWYQPVRKAQRLFFWDDERADSGVMIFLPGKTISYSRIRSLIDKLVADANLRKMHYRELEFPLERRYPDFGAFPEEASSNMETSEQVPDLSSQTEQV